MKAAFRETTLDAVFYNDRDDKRPRWFNAYVSNDIFKGDKVSEVIIRQRKDKRGEPYRYDRLISGYSVVLRNRKGQIEVIGMDDFNNSYFRVGRNDVALKEDCVDYYMFWMDDIREGLPENLYRALKVGAAAGGLYGQDSYDWWEHQHEVKQAVLLVGRDRSMRVITIRDLATHFECELPYFAEDFK